MHPIHSDMVAHLIVEDRRRAGIPRHFLPTVPEADQEGRDLSASRGLLSWFRGGARLALRHHA